MNMREGTIKHKYLDSILPGALQATRKLTNEHMHTYTSTSTNASTLTPRKCRQLHTLEALETHTNTNRQTHITYLAADQDARTQSPPDRYLPSALSAAISPCHMPTEEDIKSKQKHH